MGANTKFKDSVFSFLFSDPDILRELYCALEGVTMPKDVPITINTLQDVLFMDRINDISFEIGGKLVVLLEHQSTINPNMTFRILSYITRVYEKIVDNKSMYSTKLKPLPRPEFFVLYNGTAEFPKEKILKLSDSYESGESLGLPKKENPALELEVRVININHGKNEEIVNRCKTLASYSAFVGKVQDYEKEGLARGEAIKNAIKYCVEHDILKNFLEQNGSEVINMLLTEWNWEDALDVRYEEGKEDVARNALAEGATLEFVRKITGIDLETLKNIQTQKK